MLIFRNWFDNPKKKDKREGLKKMTLAEKILPIYHLLKIQKSCVNALISSTGLQAYNTVFTIYL